MKNINKLLLIPILILLIATIIISISYFKLKTAKINVILKDDLTTEFNSKRKISSFIKSINGKIINDVYVDTLKLGKKDITFKYINEDNITVSTHLTYEVVDKTPPIIWLNENYSIKVGSEDILTSSILCGDNFDDKPNCYIEGDYDLNSPGKYPLIFKAIDSSGNLSEKKFTLNVYEKDNTNNNETDQINFKDIVEKHKGPKTKIGLDLSKWQQEVDFSKLKEENVEFVMLRLGTTKGKNGKIIIDDYFIRNIEEASKYKIPVGIYFYSYATSKKQAIKEAKWVINQIKEYNIELPIAFDWEDWQDFNSYHLSFYKLTEIAKSFMQEIEKQGYEAMLYSSKNYLEKIWLKTNYKTWLAHYTEKTNYEGKYLLWQLCDNGKVNGIKGNVDIDIMYQ